MTELDNHAGFAISPSKFQLVEIINKNNQYLLGNVDEVYFDDQIDYNEDKETRIITLLQSAFNELNLKNPLRSSRVSFTLPFELFYIIQLPCDNSLLHQDLIEEFKWQLSILFPYIPVSDLAVQYIEIDKNILVGKNTALVTAINKKHLRLIHKFCTRNNLKLSFIDNNHFASERILTLLNSGSKGISLSAFVNSSHLSIILSIDGKPAKFRSVPYKSANEIITGILNELPGSKVLSAAYITGVDLSGSMVKTISSKTGINFIQFNPFEKIKAAPELAENKYYLELHNNFSPAAGIAYRLA